MDDQSRWAREMRRGPVLTNIGGQNIFRIFLKEKAVQEDIFLATAKINFLVFSMNGWTLQASVIFQPTHTGKKVKNIIKGPFKKGKKFINIECESIDLTTKNSCPPLLKI